MRSNSEANHAAIHNDDRNQPPTPPTAKRPGRIVSDPVIVALADICALFDTVPEDQQPWVFEHLSKRYGQRRVRAVPGTAGA